MSGRHEPVAALAGAVLMIRPAHFTGNVETQATNRFQARGTAAGASRDTARREFDALAANLAAAQIRVQIFAGNDELALPDEVFVDNWLSTHPDGSVVIYPLQAPSRRRERRRDVVAWLERDSGYAVRRVLDLSPLENEGEYLEGTGSAVIDHAQRVAFCGLSARTRPRAIEALAVALGLEAKTFTTRDRDGFAVYHTNVLLALGATFAVVCLDAIVPDDRAAVAAALDASGREVLPISMGQMHEFAANLLALVSPAGPVIALSTRAWSAFDAHQRARLERHGAIVATDIATIERLGGGSVRCMLTELWLPTLGSPPPPLDSLPEQSAG